ncbi:MAG TPA: EAL domain-containing protein [Burkholderiaceae bacterium]|jgi:diguanylate cyclase (GGDEF)-like protein
MKNPWSSLFVPKTVAPVELPTPSGDVDRAEPCLRDPLTGLPNRRAIRQHLRSRLQGGVPPGCLTTALHIDLDGFARIDAELGGADADQTILVVARRIEAALSSADTLARLDGDEFLVVLGTDAGDGRHVTALAAALRAAIARPIVVAGHDVFVSASIGIAHATAGSMKAEALLRHAASAVQRAKAAGPGSCVTCDPADASADASRQAIGQALRSATARHELRLVYQPQLDLRSGKIVGIEALLRWQHPTFGPLGPDRFIPIAEDLGLMGQIGDWVIGAACAQARAWQRAGIPLVRLTVNVSAQQLRHPEFADRLAAALARHGVEPQHFGIELTEHRLLERLDDVAAQLCRVRATGVAIALDDFGTGSSSLTCLRRLPIDSVKIDRSLMQTITSSTQTLAITRAIIAMAHGLGMTTIAEGVENEGQLELLAASRCDRFQGHHFSPAIEADDIARMLQSGAHVPAALRLRSEAAKTILILDDEPWVVVRLSEQIGWRFGSELQIESCVCRHEALARLRRGAVDVVLSDLRMPGGDGLDFLAEARALQPDLVCLMLVGLGDIGSIVNDPRQGKVFRYITKPWDMDLLLQHVGAALAHAAHLGADRLGAEALQLARCGGAAAEAPNPSSHAEPRRLIDIVDRGILGEVLMPHSLPTMPGDLWSSARH